MRPKGTSTIKVQFWKLDNFLRSSHFFFLENLRQRTWCKQCGAKNRPRSLSDMSTEACFAILIQELEELITELEALKVTGDTGKNSR
jgi:hypothetical protein